MANLFQRIPPFQDELKLQTIKFWGSNNSEQLLTIEQNATIRELTTKILTSDTGWSTMIAKSNVEMMIQLKIRHHDNIVRQLKSNDLVKNKIGSKDIVFIHLKSPNQASKGISMSKIYMYQIDLFYVCCLFHFE